MSGQMYQADFKYSQLILDLRLNAVLTAIFCGMGLSISGLFLQTLYHNPLSSPFTLGISPISSLFTSIYILFYSFFDFSHFGGSSSFLFYFLQILCSFSGALLTLYIIKKFNQSYSNKSLIILIGILIGSFAGALQQLLEIFMTERQLKTNLFWNLGSFEIVERTILLLLIIVVSIGCFILFQKSKSSNQYLLGELYAQNLGLDIVKYQTEIILITSIIIAIITSFCGPIGFIGLISPHIAKKLIRSNHHSILSIFTISIGALLCVICLIISQIGFMGSVLPINTVSSIIGVPITIYLLIRNFKW